MILIISIHGDTTTDRVMQWLRKNNAEVYRINFSDFVTKHIPVSLKLTSERKQIIIGNIVLDDLSLQNTVVWLRKFDNFAKSKIAENIRKKIGYIYTHVQDEYTEFVNSLMHLLKDAKWLCPMDAIELNKINVLDEARKCGLNIPDTILSNNKESLQVHLSKYPKSITKCVADGVNISLKPEDDLFLLSTALLTDKYLNDIPSFFIPATTQSYIEKEVELRIVYLDGEFFTTALFSQKQAHTQLDFRIMIEGKKESRMVPFILPEDIKFKLTKLMKAINMNTASIDMIYSKDKKYYFLEANPAGQYEWNSQICNYNINKHVAKYLINQINK
jgi:hypothetical protein